MPRRKIGNCSKESVKNGLLLIRNGKTIREASKESGVPFTTLRRYYHNTKHAISLDDQRLEPNYSVNKIFTIEQEKKSWNISTIARCYFMV